MKKCDGSTWHCKKANIFEKIHNYDVSVLASVRKLAKVVPAM